MWKHCLLSVVAVLSCGVLSLHAEEPIGYWRDSFNHERRQAFGPVKRRSLSETQKFLALEGERRHAVPQPLDRALTVDAPETAMVETVSISDTAVRRKATRKRKSSSLGSASRRPRARKSTAPVNELLAKSREAYNNGRLEEARRYYGLTVKADPSSVEAIERLREIDAQMN